MRHSRRHGCQYPNLPVAYPGNPLPWAGCDALRGRRVNRSDSDRMCAAIAARIVARVGAGAGICRTAIRWADWIGIGLGKGGGCQTRSKNSRAIIGLRMGISSCRRFSFG